MRIQVKARFPSIKIPRENRLAILTAIRRSNAYREMLNDVQSTYETWSSANRPHVVTRDMRLSLRQGDIGVSIDIESDIWRWLDEGFWRYVKMDASFVAKTTPRSFLSGSGGGIRSPVGWQYPPAWVEGREWTEMLQEHADTALRDDAQEILRSVMQDSDLILWQY